MKIISAKRNALINVLGWLLPTLIFLIITPLMVDKLGTVGFGIIAIIQIFTGYMTILNFGFSEAIIKHVAENIHHDRERAVKVMWLGLGLFFGAGSFGAIIIYFLAPWITHDMLNIPEKLQGSTLIALRIGSAVFLLQMISEFYRGTAIGCNNFVVPNVSKIIRVLSSAILIWIALRNDGGLIEVMMATLSGLAIGLVINIVWMQLIIPMHWISRGYSGITTELLHFGKHILVSRVASMASSKLSQLVLGSISTIANVALYEIPVRAVTAGSAILSQAMQVFFPGFSAMDKVTDIARIKKIYFSVLSIQLFLTTPFFLTFALEGKTFLAIWINNDFATESGNILTIITAAYFFSALCTLPSLVAMSFNLPRLISRYSIIRMLIAAITVLPLVNYYELTGAAMVLLLSELPAIPFLYETTKRALGENIFMSLRSQFIKHFLISLIVFGIYAFVFRPSHWYHPAFAAAIPIAYYALALLFRATSHAENKQMCKLFINWR